MCRRLQKRTASETTNETSSTPIQITYSRHNSYLSIEENDLIINPFQHESTSPVIVTESSPNIDRKNTIEQEDRPPEPF